MWMRCKTFSQKYNRERAHISFSLHMFGVAGLVWNLRVTKGRKYRHTHTQAHSGEATAIKHGAKRRNVVTNAKRGQRANRRSKLINHHRAAAATVARAVAMALLRREKMDDLCERDGHLYVGYFSAHVRPYDDRTADQSCDARVQVWRIAMWRVCVRESHSNDDDDGEQCVASWIYVWVFFPCWLWRVSVWCPARMMYGPRTGWVLISTRTQRTHTQHMLAFPLSRFTVLSFYRQRRTAKVWFEIGTACMAMAYHHNRIYAPTGRTRFSAARRWCPHKLNRKTFSPKTFWS